MPVFRPICVTLIATITCAVSGVARGDTGGDIYDPNATLINVTEQSPDLLAQLPDGFRLPYRDTRAVSQEFNWYVRHPDYLDRVFTRSRPYLPHIVAKIRERGMPLELALLPVVESAFDPFAYSHGQAAGMWQFIPATGRRFGLQQNWWYDGRRDVIESTRAALDYLERLHRIFDGDWLLAIAAYNSGEGKVRRAIRRVGAGATFWDLRLPRETEAYVPRLLALSRLVAAPHDFGISLPFVSEQPYFEVVSTGSQIDIALAAQMADMETDDLYRLNPGLNRWASPPQGPHRLLVPVNKAQLLRLRLAELPAERRVRWTRYRIREGDTLSQIAQAHKTTVSVLREANSLGGSSIRAGRHLMIPTASQAAADYNLTADNRLAQKTAARGDSLRYTVRSGDSLWDIAQAHGVGVRELARWNGMAPRDTLRVGRRLVIHGAAKSGPDVAAPPGTQRRVNYTVRRGDSLARISSRFNVSINQLRRWNSAVSKQKYLYPGQRIVMYIDVTRQSGG
ncbi:MAG: LysM peptidoglycan-binding domain-containing protein [Gammaproteobacteria bacterium]|nr:LysM peptidoglycan-binding domain-containing protein [Gammaproteobacteria bacterium]NNM20071.1 LysM peptidoglycan-binding domain-containing protein [Gammaproteobacteria bacterium]